MPMMMMMTGPGAAPGPPGTAAADPAAAPGPPGTAALARREQRAPAPGEPDERAAAVGPPVPDGTQVAAGAAAAAAAAAHALARYRAGLTESTRQAQRADLALFARFLQTLGVRPPAALVGGDPAVWRALLAGGGYSPAQVDALLRGAPGTRTVALWGAWLTVERAAWDAIGGGVLDAFREWLLGAGYALASVNRRLATVRRYALLAAQHAGDAPRSATLRGVRGLGGRAARNRDATRPVRRISSKKAAPLVIRPDAAQRLKQHDLGTPQGARDAVLMSLLLDLGLRVGEVAALTRADVDLDRGLIQVYRAKTDLRQTLACSADLATALHAYLRWRGDAPGALLWQTRRSGALTPRALGVRGARKRVATLGAAGQIVGLSPHDCRHAWATMVVAAGSDLAVVTQAGGWRLGSTMPLRYVLAQRVANAGVRGIGVALDPVDPAAADSPG
jgi:integrase